VSCRAVLMGLTAMFVCRTGVLFAFGVAAVIVVVRGLAMMVSRLLVMRSRGVMMVARGMFRFA
jgi:hypothetical protein